MIITLRHAPKALHRRRTATHEAPVAAPLPPEPTPPEAPVATPLPPQPAPPEPGPPIPMPPQPPEPTPQPTPAPGPIDDAAAGDA